MSQRGSSTGEWKRPGEHWPTNRISLMESRRLYVRATANPAQQGNAFASRRQRCRCFGTTVLIKSFTLRATGTAHQWSDTAPALTQCPERTRGRAPSRARHPAFLQRRRQPKAIAMLYRGIEYSVLQGIVRHQGSGPRPSPGPRYPGMAARGTRRLITRKKPSSALSRSNASSRI
jgi:hypothetical protein